MNKIKRGCYAFLILMLLNAANAQTLPHHIYNDKDKNTSVGSDINTFFRTGGKIYTSPFHFNTTDWIITGSVLTATGLAFFVDDDVRSFWQRNQSDNGNILKGGQIYGNSIFAGAVAGTIYVGGKIFKSRHTAATGRMLFEGLFYSGLTTTLLKVVMGRSRPYTNAGPYFFKAFQTAEPHVSFPSGHVTIAFALSSILSGRIDNTYASIALYTLATSTVIQRMYSDNHWLSDTILGAAIGYFTGRAVLKFDTGDKEKKISVLPFYERNNLGLRFDCRL